MNALYPVIASEHLDASRDFYRDLLGLELAFANDFYVALTHPEKPELQIAFVASDHESIPAAFRSKPPAGFLVTVELDDVDAVHTRAREMGTDVVLELRDEDWGQRHFIAVDPNGVLVDVVKVIPPSPEFAAQYAASALPG